MDRERLRNRFRLPFLCLVGVISTMSFESSSELSEISWDSMLKERVGEWFFFVLESANCKLTELTPGCSARMEGRYSPLLLFFFCEE